jgi:hypothetical protein
VARSYFARYRAKTGTLIGGVRQSQTSRFQSRSDAQRRLDDTIALNGGNCEGEVVFWFSATLSLGVLELAS